MPIPSDQLTVWAIVCAAITYLLRVYLGRKESGCGGCKGCGPAHPPADSRPQAIEGSDLVQIDLGPARRLTPPPPERLSRN